MGTIRIFCYRDNPYIVRFSDFILFRRLYKFIRTIKGTLLGLWTLDQSARGAIERFKFLFSSWRN